MSCTVRLNINKTGHVNVTQHEGEFVQQLLQWKSYTYCTFGLYL
jgi:hypothetical protein